METDDDFRSLFSIPLSSLFNFQRGGPHHQPPGLQPARQDHVLLPPVSGHHVLNGLVQPSTSGSSTGGAVAFGNFNSQSSADSAHFSSNEDEQCNSPLIKYDARTPINVLEQLGFEPTDMEVDSHLSFPHGSLTARPNHSEVEKMRRDRMNGSITEMAALVPACKSASRKLDKLTVLRLAVQHIKLLRARSASLLQSPVEIFGTEELRHLLSQKTSLQGFVLVLECDRARILSAANCDNSGIPSALINSSDLIGQCFVDLVHPRDADLVRQQLAVPDLATLQAQQQRMRVGADSALRRRFFCRFRAAAVPAASGKRKGDSRQFVYLSCSGFLHWSDPDPSAAAPGGDQSASEESSQPPQPPAQSTCLTLLCRPAEPLLQATLPSTVRNSQDWQFSAKLSLDACFTWVDQRVAAVLGQLPQDLLGTSLYDLVSRDDVNRLSVAHRSALKGTRSRVACRLRCAWQQPPPAAPAAPAASSGGAAASREATCQLSLVSFINPCTGRPELLSLACILQPAPVPQHHQPNQPLSFPSVVQPATSDASAPAAAAALATGPALIGTRIAAELQPQPQPQQQQQPPPPPHLFPAAPPAEVPAANSDGWLALGQLICIAASRRQHPGEGGGDESLATTRMCLLGADGGLGEEPNYGSMLWPL